MFLIDSVEELLIFASPGYLETRRPRYLVTNRRVITALLEIYNLYFPVLLCNVGIKQKSKNAVSSFHR